MAATLYTIRLSPPGHAVRLMLERKGIEHRVIEIPEGMHGVALRLVGFRGSTVPALRIDERRLQRSVVISRVIEEIERDPPLFPADPERRAAVEEAERWGDQVLQPIPRRAFRWCAARSQELRRWVAEEVVGMPMPGLMARLNVPVAMGFARKSKATDEGVRAAVAALPGHIDHVDELVAAGTIGGPEPNAADLQIATTLRVLLGWPQLGPLLAGRPAEELAMRILPEYPGPLPARLPQEWVPSRQRHRAAGPQARGPAHR